MAFTVNEIHREERLRDLGGEKYLLFFGPAGGVPPSGDSPVALDPDVSGGGLVPAASVDKVEDNPRIVRFGESVAVHPDTFGGGQFGEHPVAFEGDAVVAGDGNLTGPVAVGPKPGFGGILRASGVGDASDDRHHGDVKEVADARPAEVGV